LIIEDNVKLTHFEEPLNCGQDYWKSCVSTENFQSKLSVDLTNDHYHAIEIASTSIYEITSRSMPTTSGPPPAHPKPIWGKSDYFEVCIPQYHIH
jgi:hypothetical protein